MGDRYANKSMAEKKRHWTDKQLIDEVIKFRRRHHRWPRFADQEMHHVLYYARVYYGSIDTLILAAREELKRTDKSQFEIPCGLWSKPGGKFFTTCEHTLNCCVSYKCPIARPGAGHPQAVIGPRHKAT